MVNLQQPSHREGSRLLLVDSSVLPEVFLRVVEAKRMLAVGQVRSLSEQQGNILTVNQNIPVDGVAAVSVSARLPLPMAIETLRQNLLSLPGVTQVDILSTR